MRASAIGARGATLRALRTAAPPDLCQKEPSRQIRFRVSPRTPRALPSAKRIARHFDGRFHASSSTSFDHPACSPAPGVASVRRLRLPSIPMRSPTGEPLGAAQRPDESLLAGIANGDRAALGSLYDRHAGRLLGFAHSLGLANVDAKDVAHDVFLEIWHHAGDFDPSRGSAETWIYLRMRSRIVDHLRKASRRHASAPDPLDRPSWPNEGRWNLDSRLYLKRRLATLPESQQRVIILAFLEGCSYEEIARRLSIPFGTVKSRLASALARLREEREGGA
jgi:RNA polymerase sigma-70 factor, ECF subfamily